jgi:GNAT superfamily N-acetyltransferase
VWAADPGREPESAAQGTLHHTATAIIHMAAYQLLTSRLPAPFDPWGPHGLTQFHSLQMLPPMKPELVLEDPVAVRVLLEPIRARIFDLLRTPRSVPQLASELGTAADRLYYHVHRLADAGLVEATGTRTTGRHTERLYCRTAARVRFTGDLALGRHRPLRAFTDGLDEGLLAASADDPASVVYHAGGLTEERAAELGERLRALIGEYDDPDPPPGSRRFGILAVVAPLPPPSDGVVVRDLRQDEIGFLREMLYAALAWRPDVQLPSAEWVLAHPQVSVFHEGWGRAGDTALVAEVYGRPVGLVWYRRFTEAAHGEGFVDEATPELAIAVAAGHRGRGIGRRLLLAAHERARSDGLTRLSLSVDADNPARRLYAAVGYREHEPGDGLGRMILDLAPVSA